MKTKTKSTASMNNLNTSTGAGRGMKMAGETRGCCRYGFRERLSNALGEHQQLSANDQLSMEVA